MRQKNASIVDDRNTRVSVLTLIAIVLDADEVDPLLLQRRLRDICVNEKIPADTASHRSLRIKRALISAREPREMSAKYCQFSKRSQISDFNFVFKS